MRSRRAFVLGGLALAAAPALAAEAAAAPWPSLRGAHGVLLMRHAATEAGQGDPPGLRLDDCATQRNLSAAGREEARRAGERVKAAGARIARVYTSPWCRCRDTARLAFGQAEDWEPLSSFFDFPDREARYSESVRQRIAGYGRHDPGGLVVMVTHNVNIAALTKLSVATAELVLVRPDGCCGMRTVARLKA